MGFLCFLNECIVHRKSYLQNHIYNHIYKIAKRNLKIDKLIV